MAEASSRRWYRLTPDRLVICLLLAEGMLWLSEKYRWFGFNEKKGWTVLVAAAVVGVAMLVTLLWFVACLLFRWRFQFSIRSLLILTAAIAIPCSWLAAEMKAARNQKMLVDEIKKGGGSVEYNLENPSPGFYSYGPGLRPLALLRLQELLGDDFFGKINGVSYHTGSIAGNPTFSLDLLDNLPQLRTLEFYYTTFADHGWSRLKNLTHIQTLSLPRNTTDERLECLDGMTRLKTLGLDGTSITNDGLKHLMRVPQLEYLSLNGTKLTDDGLRHLREMPNLETIFLPATLFTDAGVECLKTLPQLRSLGLSDPSLSDAELKRLEALPHLRYLFLDGSTFTDSGLAHLNDMPELETLVLHARQMSDAGLEHLKGLRQLKRLYLYRTRVTKGGVTKLQQALLNCQIHY